MERIADVFIPDGSVDARGAGGGGGASGEGAHVETRRALTRDAARGGNNAVVLESRELMKRVGRGVVKAR